MQIFLGIAFLITSYFCDDKEYNAQPQANYASSIVHVEIFDYFSLFDRLAVAVFNEYHR